MAGTVQPTEPADLSLVHWVLGVRPGPFYEWDAAELELLVTPFEIGDHGCLSGC